MSRWMIEKDGTGIEKSGTGIEKSGTGIEKSGTGVEKSGTGIVYAGNILRRALIACLVTFVVLAGNVQASDSNPSGTLLLVVQNNSVAISWILGDSIFSGISTLTGSSAVLMLTEVALDSTRSDWNDEGVNKPNVAGAGTGINVAGAGTGINVAGAGTGINVAGAGSGVDAITITLPQGTGMFMEVAVGCGYASVAVVDSDSTPVVTFENVRVIGDASFCDDGLGDSFANNSGADFRSER